MRTITNHLVGVVFVLCVAVVPAAAAPPQPGAEAPRPVVKTGFDLAVTNIGTLGPADPCVFCPVIFVTNLGSKAVNGPFLLKYVCNGVVVYNQRSVNINLAPGATQKIPPHMPLDQNFARYGDSVEAKIDVDNQLKEDNELNNTYQEKLAPPVPRQPRR